MCLGLSFMRYHKGIILKTTLTYHIVNTSSVGTLKRSRVIAEFFNINTCLHLTRDDCDDCTFSNGVCMGFKTILLAKMTEHHSYLHWILQIYGKPR